MGNERKDADSPQDLNEAKALLSSVNKVARLLKTSPLDARKQINEVKDNVETIQEEINGSMAYLAEIKQKLKKMRTKGILALPETGSQSTFTELPSVEELEKEIRVISEQYSDHITNLNMDEQIALAQYQRNLSTQIDLMKQTNDTMEASQSTQMLVNFHQWHDDVQEFMQSDNQDLSTMLDLHLGYGEFFVDGKGDPNQSTSKLFNQLELAISLEIKNLLHDENKSPQNKLKIIESVLDNIDAKVRGTSSLGRQILPLLKELQKQISKEEYNKLPAATREKIETVLDPKVFKGTYTHDTRKSMLISQTTTPIDPNNKTAKQQVDNRTASPVHKKHKNH